MNDVINEKIGAWLLIDGNTRETLSSNLGITRATLNSRLRGESPWLWREIVALTQVVGATPNELAGIRS